MNGYRITQQLSNIKRLSNVATSLRQMEEDLAVGRP